MHHKSACSGSVRFVQPLSENALVLIIMIKTEKSLTTLGDV